MDHPIRDIPLGTHTMGTGLNMPTGRAPIAQADIDEMFRVAAIRGRENLNTRIYPRGYNPGTVNIWEYAAQNTRNQATLVMADIETVRLPGDNARRFNIEDVARAWDTFGDQVNSLLPEAKDGTFCYSCNREIDPPVTSINGDHVCPYCSSLKVSTAYSDRILQKMAEKGYSSCSSGNRALLRVRLRDLHP